MFDGHGGAVASEYLQRHLHGALKAALDRDDIAAGDSTLSLAPALTETVRFAHATREILCHLCSDSFLSPV